MPWTITRGPEHQLRFHFVHLGGWRRSLILIIAALDEFFDGRWAAICYYRTVLGNKWQIWE